MEVVWLYRNTPVIKKDNLVLALGDFDGVHLGHQALLEEGMKFAGDRPFGVFFFKKDPSLFINNGKGKTFITSLEDKILYLKQLGVTLVYVQEVDASFFELTPDEFMEKCLTPLGTVALAVGEDYRFGKMASGTPEKLKEKFDVHVAKLLYRENEKIASRNIKSLIAEGKIEEANSLLGHPYRVKGEIQEGLHKGRKIGFPTVNLKSDFPYVLPKDGVYIGKTEINGKPYESLINVGMNPTVGVLDESTIEAHLKDFNEKAYGKDIKVYFEKFVRDEIKFESMDALKEQIEEDFKKL